MDKQLRFAVILAGCGNKDGAEIQESVLTLLAIDKAGHSYQCFAPNIPQKKVLNFLTNEELKESRNVLVESARIARSNIKDLEDFKAEDFDILVLPGGFGVALNLCSFATQGANMTVIPQVERAVKAMHEAKKPIAALCISPVIIAELIPAVHVTFGKDEAVNAIFKQKGATVSNKEAEGIVIDAKNKIVTTPCYMLKDARISQLSQGIDATIKACITLVNG